MRVCRRELGGGVEPPQPPDNYHTAHFVNTMTKGDIVDYFVPQ